VPGSGEPPNDDIFGNALDPGEPSNDSGEPLTNGHKPCNDSGEPPNTPDPGEHISTIPINDLPHVFVETPFGNNPTNTPLDTPSTSADCHPSPLPPPYLPKEALRDMPIAI